MYLMRTLTPLLLLAGCVQIEGTIEDVCLHRTGLAIEGLPLPEGVALSDQMASIEQEFVHDDFDALDPILDTGLETEVFFTGATLRPIGNGNLDFVRNVQLVGSSADPDAALPMLDIGSCSDADCFAEQEVSLAGNEEIDVMEYISTGSLEFRMTVSGDLPREDWALDVDICLRGTVKYEASL